MRITFSAGVLALSVVVRADPDTMYEGECVDLAQRVHSITYDIDVSSKKIVQISNQMASYAESESADEAEMSDHAQTLLILRKDIDTTKRNALAVSSSLKKGQDRAKDLQSKVNQTSADIKLHQQSLQNLRQHQSELSKQIDETDSKIRRSELRSQMLANDIDSVNKTLSDSLAAIQNRKSEVLKAEREVKRIELLLHDKKSEAARASTVHRDILSALEKTKRDLISNQEMLLNETHKKDTQERMVSGIRMRIDGAKIDIASKLHSLKVLNDTVLNQTISRLSALKLEESRLQNASNAAVDHIRTLRSIMNHTASDSASPSVDDPVIASLRTSLRQSRSFLSTNGYLDHLSLIQIEPRVELDSLKSETQLLTLQDRLRETKEDELNTQESLNSTLEAEKKQELTIFDIQSKESNDEKELSVAAEALVKISEQVQIISRRNDVLVGDIKTMKEKEKVSEKTLSEVASQLDSVKGDYVKALSAQDLARKTFEQLGRDADKKRDQLNRQNIEKSEAEGIVKAEDSHQKSLNSELRRAMDMSDNVGRELKELLARIDADTTRRSEALADVAQLMRRLEDKMHEYEDAVSRETKERNIVDDMKSSIERSLRSRETFEISLSQETTNRERLHEILRNARKRMSELKCNV